MDISEFIILSLATWRISSMWVEEEGPFCIFEKLRRLLGVRQDEDGYSYGINEIGHTLSCIWCTSIWVALGWFLAWLLIPCAVYVATPFALTGLGIFMHGRGVRYRKHG